MFKEQTSRTAAADKAATHEAPVSGSVAANGNAPKTSSGEPYVNRRAACWRVLIQRDGSAWEKYFHDSLYGGAAAALEAAKAWRDDTFRALPAVSKAQAVARVRGNNSSGVTGVLRVSKQRDGGHIDWWLARSPAQPGQPRRCKTFSIARYGEAQAFERAVQARRAFEAELADIPHLPMYAAKQLAQRLGPGTDVKRDNQIPPSPVVARVAPAGQVGDEAREPHVFRLQQASRTSGSWRVKFQRNGDRYAKSFADDKHGGATQALAAAKAWRDEILHALPWLGKMPALGVRRRMVDGNAEAWVAYSPRQPGQPQRSTAFRIRVYGEQQAFELAVRARQAFEAALSDSGGAASSMRAAYHREPRQAMLPAPPTAPGYDAVPLLDAAMRALGVQTDFALGRALGMPPPVLSRLRNRRLAADLAMVLRIQEATGIAMADLEGMLRPLAQRHG